MRTRLRSTLCSQITCCGLDEPFHHDSFYMQDNICKTLDSLWPNILSSAADILLCYIAVSGLYRGREGFRSAEVVFSTGRPFEASDILVVYKSIT